MNWTKAIWPTLLMTLLLLGVLEGAVRIYAYINLGSSVEGIRERTQNLNYQVFTMWGKDLDGDAAVFLREHGDAPVRILLLGGSTAQLYAPGTLESAFEKQLGKKVAVFNAASWGFNVRQEAIALSLIAEKIQPTLILALDGGNDIQHALLPGVKTGTTYLDQTYRRMLQRPYLGPVIYVLQHSQLFTAMIRSVERRQFSPDELRPSVQAAVDNYLSTHDFMRHYAQGAGVPIVFMSQPNVVFSTLDEDKQAQRFYKHRFPLIVEGTRQIAERTPSDVCFVDANRVMVDQKRSLHFSDNLHFRDEVAYQFMSDLFARRFADCYGNTAAVRTMSTSKNTHAT